MILNLDELEQLAAQATPGPWRLVEGNKYSFTSVILPPDFPQTPSFGRIRDKQNAAYIVAACNSLLDIIKLYREADDKANNAWRILLEAQARIVEVQKRVQELEAQRDWLVNELCVGPQCDFPSQIECKYRTERGYYCLERKEKFRCWVAHAEKATKEGKC